MITPARDRTADLDSLPSPYLNAEFDAFDAQAWSTCVSLETNRGCPYGCTFCDWGSATRSRIRKFALDRVKRELRWAAERHIAYWSITDANFGIIERDVEIAEEICRLKAKFGVPVALGFCLAKNTTRHLTEIVRMLVDSGIVPLCSLSLQTIDRPTLEAIDRRNISVGHYESLATSFRRLGLPLIADLLLGLPGQTPSTFSADLQFCFDQEITPRIWLTHLLPNAPMNDPDYRDYHEIVASADGIVLATSSFSESDREYMLALRTANRVFEHFGLLRHVLRYLQWDGQIGAMEVIERIVAVTRAGDRRYPLLGWIMHHFDHLTVPPVGWSVFRDEVERFLSDQFSMTSTVALETVWAVQQSLLPDHGRMFPATVELPHDYVRYYRTIVGALLSKGDPPPRETSLDLMPATSFTVVGDPTGLCRGGLGVNVDPDDPGFLGDFWLTDHFELDSALLRNLAEVAANDRYTALPELHRWEQDQRPSTAQGSGVVVRSAV